MIYKLKLAFNFPLLVTPLCGVTHLQALRAEESAQNRTLGAERRKTGYTAERCNQKRDIQMDIITLNIYTDAAKAEILGFLKKFKPQDAEFKYEAEPSASSVTAHPFFGMLKDNRETVEETMSRLRGPRY